MDEKQKEELFSRVREEQKKLFEHVPYGQRGLETNPDFEVEYSLNIDPILVGVKPSQGMRCDFLYDGDDPKKDGIHIIWPEIMDGDGNIITDKKEPIPEVGRATMWIGDPESRKIIHCDRIKVGAKGHWVIGSKILADVVVTKVIGLLDQ